MKPPSSFRPGGGKPGGRPSGPVRPGGPRPSSPRPIGNRPIGGNNSDNSRADGDRAKPPRPAPAGPKPPRREEYAARQAAPTRAPSLNTLRAPPAAHPPDRPERPERPERGHGGRGEGGRGDGGRDAVRQSQRRPQYTQQAAAPDAPRGTVWLYGHHAVAAALANPARRLRRLLLTEEAAKSLAERQPPPWPLAHETTDRARLDHLLGRDVVHQGCALLADHLATPSLAQVLERPGPILVLDQVTDPRNVGAILRSAQAFAAAAVVTQDRNAPEESGALARAASGALETMPLLRAVNIARTLIALKAAGCWVIGLDSDAPARLAGPALAERRVALVLGAEGSGLRRLTRDTCDELAMLAMPGLMESLNVSAAATVALYELSRP